MSNNYVKIFLLLLVLVRFFGLVIIPFKPSAWDYPFMAILAYLIIDSINITSIYAKLIVSYVFFVVVSCLYSAVFHDQNFLIVFFHTYNYIAVVFFFYLLKKRVSSKEAIQILISFSLVCCLCYILQWLIHPFILFEGAEDEIKASATQYRVRTPGSIGCYCLFLYGFNKFLLSKKYKYLLFSLIGFLPILIMGFRSLVSLAVASFFLMIPFVVKSTGKTIIYSILGTVFALSLMQTIIVQFKIAEMNKRNLKEQTYSNENYIRWKEFDYLWNEHFKDPVEKFLGGGLPADTKSLYSRKLSYVRDYYRLFWNDLGLVGLSMMIGIPAVILLAIMYATCIWRLKEPQFQFLRFTLIIVLIGGIFTTAEVFRKGNILLFSLFLYIEYKYHKEKKWDDIKMFNKRILKQ